jgi:hypothetical protein
MAKKNHTSKVNIAEADVKLRKSVDELTEAIVEDLRDRYHSDLEPFEIYANRVRQQVCDNLQDFRDRFLQGYSVLLDELEKESTDQENKSGERPLDGTKK